MFTRHHLRFGLLLLAVFAFANSKPADAQNADTKPLVAVYPIKPYNKAPNASPNPQVNSSPFGSAGSGAKYQQNVDIDSNVIFLNIEEGLRKGKKVKLFERGASGMDSIRQEQFRADCGNGNGGAQSGALQSGQTLTPKAEIIDECVKRFAGNAAATGQMSNVEFIVDVTIMDVTIGEAIFEPIPEMPGKYNRILKAKIDVSVKVLDSTSGQIKFQEIVSAPLTDRRLVQNESNPFIDWKAISNRLATEAGRKAAAAINDAIKT